jgi:large-conductance mechanosensitive channel
MGIQEIITFLIVGAAIFFTGKIFFRQFTRGEQASPKCADCALNKIRQESKKSMNLN